MKHAGFGESDADTHHLKSVGNLGRMKNRSVALGSESK
jgi:hypothetical protein